MTKRQYEIALLVAEGLSNKHIARLLSISDGTVKLHLHSIFEKFNFKNRTALAIAVSTGLVSTPDLKG